MEKPLVTLLSPCYNTGKYVHRLLDSVLSQSWPNLEMIAVDDGSTDDTAKILESYVEKFERRGYTLRILRQKNSGQSAAISNGLEFVRGKYLAWPDSDDFYASPLAIEKMVNALENAPEEFAMVRTQQQMLRETDLQILYVQGKNVKPQEDKSLFEDFLYGWHDYYPPAGSNMVRFEALKNSARWPMYVEKDAGQNAQLSMPILWNYRCLSIAEELYCVLVRTNSHSRGQYKGFEREYQRYVAWLNEHLGTFDRILNMPEDVREEYKRRYRKFYDYRFMKLAFDYNRPKEFFEFWKREPDHPWNLCAMAILFRLHLVGIFLWFWKLFRGPSQKLRSALKKFTPKFALGFYRKLRYILWERAEKRHVQS